MEFVVESLPDFTFRIKKMNSIEMLALQNQIKFDDMESTEKSFYSVLKFIEVNVNGKWLPCLNGKDIIPVKLEEDVNAMNEVFGYFMKEYFVPVFRKSNESKK